MSELPKFVLQRLAASAAPGEHPGADLLAAFVEQSLATTERDKLLAHLAACGHCREVLWCSWPEAGTAQQVTVAVAPRRWRHAWRWAGVAAGVVILAGAAVFFRGGPGPAGEKMALAPRPPAVTQPGANLSADLSAPAASKPDLSAPAAASKPSLQAKAVPPKVAPARRGRASANQVRAIGRLQESAGALAPESAAAAAPASTSVAGEMIASNLPAPPIGKKKLAPPTRWMLSPQGALLRSTDAGENWQAVPFAHNPAFHAVAVVGAKVWVGGQDGALFYSADDGSHWQQLALPAASLHGDIVSLTFHDGRHGTLTTSSGETLATSDGGRTWR